MNHLLQYFGKFLLNLGHYESVDCSKWNGGMQFCFVLLLLLFAVVVVVFWIFKKEIVCVLGVNQVAISKLYGENIGHNYYFLN